MSRHDNTIISDVDAIHVFDRFKGCLYGQAIGDALGLGTEGMTDEDMAWKYPHGLQHYSQIFQDRIANVGRLATGQTTPT